MKVVTAKEMMRVEKLAYEQGESEEKFMHSAGIGIAAWVQGFVRSHNLKPIVTLLCGSGNNAGDAYVAGKLLRQSGFKVYVFALSPFASSTPLCQVECNRFIQDGGSVEYVDEKSLIDFRDSEVLLDGILGTGFHGELSHIFKHAIESANKSGLPILSIDIPSGVNGTTGEVASGAIVAKETLFLGLPKTGCFIGDSWNFVGTVRNYNFGLNEKYINQAKADFNLIEDQLIRAVFPRMSRNRHKYQAGYVVGFGGSIDMPGASIMASLASLRSGAGIVRLIHPSGMESTLSSAPYEIVRQGYEDDDLEKVFHEVGRASSIFVGPGMGVNKKSEEFLKRLLPQIKVPCVIDADALTIISHGKIKFPETTIITPHHGEMMRLLKMENKISVSELLKKSQDYVERHKIICVLKGSPTFVLSPKNSPYLCSRGDPGMATAGCGDVLTGMIASFLAQKCEPINAAVVGVQLHAMAGENAAKKYTSYCMVATDIIDSLPSVFNIPLNKVS